MSDNPKPDGGLREELNSTAWSEAIMAYSQVPHGQHVEALTAAIRAYLAACRAPTTPLPDGATERQAQPVVVHGCDTSTVVVGETAIGERQAESGPRGGGEDWTLSVEGRVRRLAEIIRNSVSNPGCRPHAIIMPDGSKERGSGIDVAVEMMLKVADTVEAIADFAARTQPQPGAINLALTALSYLATLAPHEDSAPVSMSDPLSKWFTIANFCEAADALAALTPRSAGDAETTPSEET